MSISVSTTAPRIRQATSTDHAMMLDLWERSVRATHAFLTGGDIEELRPQVAAGFLSDAVTWWVLCGAGDEPLGFLGLTPGRVEALFIDPDHHRRGFGRLLLAHAQSLARGPLRLDVNEGNPGAVAFYQSQGFEVAGRSPTDTDGRPFPLLHMERQEPTPT